MRRWQLPQTLSGACCAAPAIITSLWTGRCRTAGVELVQVLAKSQAVPLHGIAADISGTMDRSRPVRPDVSLFNYVRLNFRMKGVTEQQGWQLVEAFKGR